MPFVDSVKGFVNKFKMKHQRRETIENLSYPLFFINIYNYNELLRQT